MQEFRFALIAKKHLISFGLCLLIIGGGTPKAAENKVRQLVITDALVLDGRGGRDAVPRTVIVDNGLISATLPADAAPPKGGTVIDAEGQYLLPGFIDAHAHILVPRCGSFLLGKPLFDRELSEEMASKLLDFGITTVRSPATPTIAGLALRDTLNQGLVRGPQVRASAELLNDPHMSEEELRAYVRGAMAYQPDYFKVYARLSPAQVKTVIDEAHAHNVPVIGHLGRTSWAEAAAFGIDYLTHAVDWSSKALKSEYREAYRNAVSDRGAMRARLDWLEWLDLQSTEVNEMIEALVAHHIPIDPTLVAYDAKFSHPAYPRYRSNPNVDAVPDLHADWQACRGWAYNWTDEDFARWRQLFPKLQMLVRMMHDRGVLLLTGSDVPNEWVIPGESLHQEFELLVESGIPPEAVLKMAAADAAHALKLSDRGIIETGRRADLVLLAENPLQDIRNTRKIVWVMQGGEIVWTR